MKIHLIAIGGAVMHNLAIALKANGHHITGSDDEIYNPSRDRLKVKGLLPKKMGWQISNIKNDLDLIILGKHARENNPELLKAKELGLRILSFPEFIYEHAKDKIRVAVTGSHGKTTTTAMIMHVLRHAGRSFDYLVGAQLEGFDTMVGLSDAEVMIIEGDEYPSSPIDLRPKMLLYQPHIVATTGIAWDHVNIFTTYDMYVLQFKKLLKTMASHGTNPPKWFWYEYDKDLRLLAEKAPKKIDGRAYRGFRNIGQDGRTAISGPSGQAVDLQFFGSHNLQNLKATYLITKELGVSDTVFFEAIKSFTGAAKRLQTLHRGQQATAFLDFAHAPSKARATVKAVKEKFPDQPLIACLELHTFSSLNKDFLPQYKGSLSPADHAFVYYSPHTLKMKQLPHFSKDEAQKAFGGKHVHVFTDSKELEKAVQSVAGKNANLLWMSSGTFGGLDVLQLSKDALGAGN